ncbi:MBL fold metallo-hydrolase [Rothia sp. ZJ932]|uniref:MBL fold metallo-hydrolase n=1 Tax=Rothia sp. ZJ932 TaxID=2810516 RepID=UPI0019672F9B|nr:MBL fold metallo-hydrolase [Rothia sp. ZJ932]QRZ62295.1 MBL fold metallo-hydrolase [Rothia sp. ZJ932]
MRLTIIGNSGSFPSPHSPASCYMVTATDDAGKTWRIVLDMGNGAFGVLQRHVDLKDVDAILISHLHPDHCIDLSGVHVAVKWDPRGWEKEPIPLYGPSTLHDYLRHTHGHYDEVGMSTEFNFHSWAHHEQVHIGPFTVTPFEVLHPTEEPYAMRIECTTAEGKTVLTYSGDTDYCRGIVEASQGADLLLCEAAYQEGRDDALRGIHLTGKRAGQVAEEAGVRNLLLTHLPVWTDPATALAEAQETFSGPTGIAEVSASYRVHPHPQPTNPPTTTLSVVQCH